MLIALQAQTVTLPVVPVNTTYQAYATAQTLRADTALVFVYTAIKFQPTTQDFVVRLDTLGATKHTSVAVAIHGQKSAQKGDWTAIGSAVTWYRTTTDTVMVIANATANRYRSYKLTVTGSSTAGARSKVSKQEFKQWLE